MTYQDQQNHGPASDWLMHTVRRKPEALLLLAAGCALLMRSGRRRVRSPVARWEMGDNTPWDPKGPSVRASAEGAANVVTKTASQVSEYAAGAVRQAGETVDRMTDAAKSYASSVADSVGDYADTAKQRASNIADQAQRNLAEKSDQLRSQAETTYQTAAEIIREQPVLVAALGLMAGAVMATLFPATEVEKRSFRVASDALADRATEVGETLLTATTRAGDNLKKVVSDRGLDAEGLKNAAREVAGTFASAVTEKSPSDTDRATTPAGSTPSRNEDSSPGARPTPGAGSRKPA
jgi:ElaB/YqjD/DUF883 family membrane-anchored ribosome-binding protein